MKKIKTDLINTIKIIHLVHSGEKDVLNPWVNENLQRNFIIENLDLNNDDKIIISDVDEIPSKIFINKLHNFEGNEILISVQELSYFWPNYRRNDLPFWIGGSRGFNFKNFKNLKFLEKKYSNSFLKKFNSNTTLTKIRLTNVGIPVNNGGWHLSYMGGLESIKKKILSFAHNEEKERIGEDIDSFLNKFLLDGKDFFGKNEYYVSSGTFKPTVLLEDYVKKNKLTLLLKFKWKLYKRILILKIKLKYYAKMFL